MKREYYKKYELVPQASCKPAEIPQVKHAPKDTDFLDKFLNFQSDELLIIALIVALLTEDSPDYLTIIALGFILLS